MIPVETLLLPHGGAQMEVFACGRGRPVILIPSLGRGAEDFADLAQRVAAAGCRALCPQPRGIGRSNGTLQGITLHDLAADMAALIRHQGGEPAVLAGHAFGNFVARTTAADHPRLVRAVVLLAATHLWPVPADIRASIEKSHDMSLPADVRLKHLQHAFFAPGNDASVWLTGWHEAVMHAERSATETTPRSEWWHAGTAPVLDLQAGSDVMEPPESVNRYRDELGADRVEIAVVPNAGHALLPEQPEKLGEVLVAWLQKIGHVRQGD